MRLENCSRTLFSVQTSQERGREMLVNKIRIRVTVRKEGRWAQLPGWLGVEYIYKR